MNGYNFTERVRKVLELAREEAARLNHEYVGTEHILLGLIREGQGLASAVLQSLGADPDDIEQLIEQHIKKGPPAPIARDLPYTSRAKKVLELAMAEARELNHSYIGTEHLLLGLLREERGIAAQVLNHLGVTLTAAREESLQLLGSSASGAAVTTPARDDRGKVSPSEGRKLPPLGFRVRVDCEGGYWFAEQFERVEEAITFLQKLPPSPPRGGA
ncbi:MAG TPA: Clp protease N-terminal domain-containing protein [Gemmatimonadaceae bacterium]|nr:Clp protease N-terminal domain-containing protein [Gemmatimonadaceae bacterium]